MNHLNNILTTSVPVVVIATVSADVAIAGCTSKVGYSVTEEVILVKLMRGEQSEYGRGRLPRAGPQIRPRGRWSCETVRTSNYG